MNAGGPVRRVIDDRFELVNRLGSGGMGMVWRAHDLALHRDVALKEVRPPDPALAENDPEAARLLRARVLREARALARLDHPGVVTVHHIVDGGEHAYPWIVMELVPGASLAERLAEGTLTPVEAAELGRGVLSALRAAHDRTSSSPSGTATEKAKEAETANEAKTKDLLTPAGARSVIAALKPVMGGNRVTSFSLYEEHARIEAPVKNKKGLYDVYAYRDGEATRERAGGTLMPGAKSVDLEKFDWDALPGLIRRADKALGVTEPTSHYVDIDPASPFDDYQPTLSVYVSDEYGGAYLRADINGKVLKKYPRNG
ncbi:serine/threonine-protein kinase [Streptomyces sp. NPDC002012]|uniref:serine/threonine-protein kinase n=1 Tax=Streptomyces sp. NPDC002012 TaxID=3154532 RepID=UPI00331E7C58